MTPVRRLVPLALLLVVASPTCLFAQTTSPTTAPSQPTFEPASRPTTQPETQPATAPVRPALPPPPFPLAELATKADDAVAAARRVEGDLAGEAVVNRVRDDVARFEQEIEKRGEETARIIQGTPSIQDVNAQQDEWERLAALLERWKGDLGRRAGELDRHVRGITEQSELWQRMLEFARADDAPPEVVQRAEQTQALLSNARRAAERRRGEVLGLQGRASDASARVADVLASVRAARDTAVSRLWATDAPAIWSVGGQPPAPGAVAAASEQSFGSQVAALRAYVGRNASVVAVHALVLLGLVPALFWVRNRVRAWVAEDPTLERAVLVFETPIATAVLLAMLASGWFYPSAPRLLWAVVVAIALPPTVVILRRLLHRSLYPVLYAVCVTFAVDQLRAVAASQAVLARWLLLGETVVALLFLVWMMRSGRLAAAVGSGRDRLTHVLMLGARAIGVLLVASTLANAAGYVRLASLIGDATLASALLALLLYAATRVADALIMSALRARPLTLLASVTRNRKPLWHRARRVLHWVAVLLWVLATLEMFSLRTPVLDRVGRVLTASLTVGSFSLSLGQVIAFALTVYASILLSRLVRFLLDEDVYPRFHLDRGLPYAISTTLHYVILLVGFVLAVGMLGYDLTKFTILAGAFGVGLGFGLQNIFNNFISGLILLFERPIKVGDVIQIGADAGVVRRIGIRASVVRLNDGAEVIMPNGKLISDPVTNWTLSDRRRGVKMTLTVARDTDADRVAELWKRVAFAHPAVVEVPPPKALMTGFAAGALSFELHAWVSDFEESVQARSDLSIALNRALVEAGIELR